MSHRRIAATLAAGAAVLFALVGPASAANRTQSNLDDSTIVAIFDAANTADIETDHAFLQHEVAYHQGVIDAVTKTLLPAIQNAELKALVVKVAPAFEAHRAAAKALDEKLTKK